MSEDLKLIGTALPLDELLAMAEIDTMDIDEALEWWDEYASDDFVGALDE